MTPTFLARKATATGFQFRIDGKGPWRSEANTDSLVQSTLGRGAQRGEFPIVEGGVVVGTWVQEMFCHEMK